MQVHTPSEPWVIDRCCPYYRYISKCRTRKGHLSTPFRRTFKEFSVSLFHFFTVAGSWTVRSFHLHLLYPSNGFPWTMIFTDNLGLMPYRRRIVSVSECIYLYITQFHSSSFFFQLGVLFTSSRPTNQHWKKSLEFNRPISRSSWGVNYLYHS